MSVLFRVLHAQYEDGDKYANLTHLRHIRLESDAFSYTDYNCKEYATKGRSFFGQAISFICVSNCLRLKCMTEAVSVEDT